MKLLVVILPLLLPIVGGKGFVHRALDTQGRAIFTREGIKRVMYENDDQATTGEGSWTEWLNMDHPDSKLGSTGDYEWVLESIYSEMFVGTCFIPCDADDITAMEVDILGTDQDEDYIKTCLDLEAKATAPQTGFYCMNNMQRKPQSKCQSTEQCHALMTSHCQCPDARVRYFCATSADEQQEHCDRVEENFQGGGVFRQLKRMLGGQKRTTSAAALRAYALRYLA